MATVNGINSIRMGELSETAEGSSILSGAAAETDERTKELTNQIQEKQLELQRLSSDETMAEEEKQQKRQELLKQVSSLNTELRQHQQERQREKLAEDKENNNGLRQGSSSDQDSSSTDASAISAAGMQAIISADTAVRQSAEQGSVVSTLTGRVQVLESELQLDQGRGRSSKGKADELENLSYAVTSAKQAQLGIVGNANSRLAKVMNTERKEQREQPEIKRHKKMISAEKANISTPKLAKSEAAAAGAQPSFPNTTAKLYSSTGRTLTESMGFSVSIKG